MYPMVERRLTKALTRPVGAYLPVATYHLLSSTAKAVSQVVHKETRRATDRPSVEPRYAWIKSARSTGAVIRWLDSGKSVSIGRFVT